MAKHLNLKELEMPFALFILMTKMLIQITLLILRRKVSLQELFFKKE